MEPRGPVATYRVQLGPDFDLYAAAGVADYLATLGVSHAYTSPLLQAAPGSTHGYDVVDFSRVSADLGAESGRKALVAALRAAGLGLVVDIVPNHTGVRLPPENPAWWDLLR
ncbi:MAG: alpha-amylase family glycosyl hydrolase, partial [Micromonosporaceae bacterium]